MATSNHCGQVGLAGAGVQHRASCGQWLGPTVNQAATACSSARLGVAVHVHVVALWGSRLHGVTFQALPMIASQVAV